MVTEELKEMRRAFYKIHKVIGSCENALHVKTATKLLDIFYEKYSSLPDIPEEDYRRTEFRELNGLLIYTLSKKSIN